MGNHSLPVLHCCPNHSLPVLHCCANNQFHLWLSRELRHHRCKLCYRLHNCSLRVPGLHDDSTIAGDCDDTTGDHLSVEFLSSNQHFHGGVCAPAAVPILPQC